MSSGVKGFNSGEDRENATCFSSHAQSALATHGGQEKRIDGEGT